MQIFVKTLTGACLPVACAAIHSLAGEGFCLL